MNEEQTAPQPPEPTPGSFGPEAALAPEISRRVGSILDAVEREASRLREEARAEASRYAENARRHADGLVEARQRRISALSDELIAKSEAVVARLDDAAPVRDGFENLVRALGDAAERLSQVSGATKDDFAPPPFYEAARQPPPRAEPPPPAVPHQQGPPLHYPQPPAHQTAPPQQPAQPANWQGFEDARMVSIQMASAGYTRSEVRNHLSHAFGIADAEAMLDEIFGRGAGRDARVP